MLERVRQTTLIGSLRLTLAALLVAGACAACISDDAGADPTPESSATPRATTAIDVTPGASGDPSPTSFLRPTSVVDPTQTPLPEPVMLAINRAAMDRDTTAADIVILDFHAETWSSTALGCPEDGRSYAQIVTSGYEVLLSVVGEIAVYHVDQSGAAIVECKRGNRD